MRTIRTAAALFAVTAAVTLTAACSPAGHNDAKPGSSKTATAAKEEAAQEAAARQASAFASAKSVAVGLSAGAVNEMTSPRQVAAKIADAAALAALGVSVTPTQQVVRVGDELQVRDGDACAAVLLTDDVGDVPPIQNSCTK